MKPKRSTKDTKSFVQIFVTFVLLCGYHSFSCVAQERDRVLKAANQYLREAPITITASKSPRSAGGVHDFFSEGDYWWPNTTQPDGPYVQRDGETNPENFVDHRHAMVRMSIQVATLTSAWRITDDKKYADKAVEHLKAWFVD